MNHKVANSLQMRVMNRNAEDNNYNRQLSDAAMAKLDPRGFHIVTRFIVHEHAAGVKVEPHYRCRVHLKLLTSDEPVVAWLDVTTDDYDRLPDAEAVERELEAVAMGDKLEGRA